MKKLLILLVLALGCNCFADYMSYRAYNYQRNFNLKIRRMEAKKIKKIGKIYGVNYYKNYSYSPVDSTYYDRQLQLNGVKVR